MTLTRNAPVGALADHLYNSFTAPSRYPLDVFASFYGVAFESVDRAEPLRRRSEDDRILASPAVRIFVLYYLGRKERARFFHIVKYRLIGLFVVHSGELSGVGGLVAAVVDRNDYLHVVLLTDKVVVSTESGSDMNATGTAVHRDVLCVDYETFAVEEGVTRGHILELAALHSRFDGVIFNSAVLHRLFKTRVSYDIAVARVGLGYNVILDRIERNGEVAGHCPRGSRPDDEVGFIEVVSRQFALVVGHLESDVNGRAFIGLIFDLRLGKSCFVVRTPINRFKSLVNVTLAEHFSEYLDLSRLERRRHREIGIIPIGNYTETLELLSLNVDEVLGEVLASAAELGYAHFLAVELVLLYDSALDRHSVVVPTRSERYAVAAHRLRLVYKVFQYFVERVTHVQFAVRERGAVVKHEGRLSGGVFKHLAVKVDILPTSERLRFSFGKVCPHRELG